LGVIDFGEGGVVELVLCVGGYSVGDGVAEIEIEEYLAGVVLMRC
jgi:hypothetical protein